MKKRYKVMLSVAALFSAALISIIIYSVYFEPKTIILEKIGISFRSLPKSFDGYKIALLSDLHYSDKTSNDVINDAIKIVNEIQPDIILIAGDFISETNPELNTGIASCMEFLTKLKAKSGIFAVLGNHDHWAGAERITDALKRAGITVLRNSHKRININKEYIYIVGIDDFYWGSGSIKKALVSMKYPDAFKILLTHIPDAAFEANDSGIDFVAAGHTHGGQIKLPFYKSFIMNRFIFSDLIAGRYNVGDAVLYVTRGIGTVWLPARFRAKPEVTEITLRRE